MNQQVITDVGGNTPRRFTTSVLRGRNLEGRTGVALPEVAEFVAWAVFATAIRRLAELARVHDLEHVRKAVPDNSVLWLWSEHLDAETPQEASDNVMQTRDTALIVSANSFWFVARSPAEGTEVSTTPQHISALDD